MTGHEVLEWWPGGWTDNTPLFPSPTLGGGWPRAGSSDEARVRSWCPRSGEEGGAPCGLTPGPAHRTGHR